MIGRIMDRSTHLAENYAFSTVLGDCMQQNIFKPHVPDVQRGCNIEIKLVVILIVSTLFLVACPTRTTLADINRDPGKYQGKEITVAGRVSDAFGALGTGVFQIDDGTGRLWVFSQNYGVPGSGAKVSVTGRLEQGFSFGGRSFALALRQTQARH
jgi:hypothetical protein